MLSMGSAYYNSESLFCLVHLKSSSEDNVVEPGSAISLHPWTGECHDLLASLLTDKQVMEWKYEMQMSMLEICNNAIHDCLVPNRYSLEAARPEISSKLYAIKHDANGNTHVSDLTIVDVCSIKEVSFLLEWAEQSREGEVTGT